MQFPVSFRDDFGNDLIIDIGLGNPNENAFSVVFPEPMSVVDAALGSLARDPISPAYMALRSFLGQTGQYDMRRMQPRDVTRFARQAFIERRLVLGRRPRLLGLHSLRFDGKSLDLVQGDRAIRRWSGVSGRPGYQSVEHQETKDTGPLPEGRWLARQSRFERIGAYGSVAGLMGRGTWPGSTASWGQFRIWLEPLGNTKTYDRSGFSIHGGVSAGSAGCIDLTSSMEDFVRYFLAYGRDMTLLVEYPPPPKSMKSLPK
jgi:hypothetical protein